MSHRRLSRLPRKRYWGRLALSLPTGSIEWWPKKLHQRKLYIRMLINKGLITWRISARLPKQILLKWSWRLDGEGFSPGCNSALKIPAQFEKPGWNFQFEKAHIIVIYQKCILLSRPHPFWTRKIRKPKNYDHYSMRFSFITEGKGNTYWIAYWNDFN